jgi:hypothetical protein
MIGKRVSFPVPVAEALDYQSVTIVRLDVPPGAAVNEHVFGVDDQGAILWRGPKKGR